MKYLIVGTFLLIVIIGSGVLIEESFGGDKLDSCDKNQESHCSISEGIEQEINGGIENQDILQSSSGENGEEESTKSSRFSSLKKFAKKSIDKIKNVGKRFSNKAEKFLDKITPDADDKRWSRAPLRISANITRKFLSIFKEKGKRLGDIAEDIFDIETPRRTSRKVLQECERDILKDVKGEVKDVVVEEDEGDQVIIHTVIYEATKATTDDQPSKTPLVLLHGYGGGLACFHMNFQSLSQKRKVYAIDLPGFALSSRVEFPKEPEKCRDRMVKLIEKWRVAMNLEKFIILGHSFGGYIAGSYTLKYTERVRHLILAEPWGVLSKEEDDLEPSLVKRMAVLLKLEPYKLLAKTKDIGRYFYNILVPKKIKEIYGKKMVEYFYHCNAQDRATGEKAFATMGKDYFWAHTPLKKSLETLDPSVPITFLYGKTSGYFNSGGVSVTKKRKSVHLPAPMKAGHHIQIENHEEFNKRVNEVCQMVDDEIDHE